MMRLVHLIWILGAVTGTCLAGSQQSVTKDSKILILGAGMSGISAAKTLDEAGYQYIVIVEGSSAVGGRMRSAQLSENTVELGAHWLYGKGANPIYKLLVDNGISIAEDYPDTWTVLNTTGNDITHAADKAQLRFEAAIKAVDSDGKEAMEKNVPDFSLRSRLRSHGWEPNTIVEEVIDDMNIDYEVGASPNVISGKYADLWAAYDTFGSEEMLPLNDARGYKHLVEILAEPFTSSNQIEFNEVVKQINQTKDGVEILTDSGTRYQGDYVIVTFSLGVLQSRTVAFSPALPSCMQLAIDKMEMALMTLIYLKFPTMFWNDKSLIVFASEQLEKYRMWVNMNNVLPGSNILQLAVWGEESKRVERLEDRVIVDELLQYLSTMYPDREIPKPINYTMSRWTYDPLFRGAYIYWPTGFTENNMADMMAPFGRVLFAGAHLDPEQGGYVHGAYASGIKTGKYLIQCLQDPGRCLSYFVDGFECSRGETVDQDCSTDAGARTIAGLSVATVAFATHLQSKLFPF